MSEPLSESWLERVVAGVDGRARKRVAHLRVEHPDAAPRELAEKLVRSYARRAGLGGAATGTLSLVALPVGLPAGLALTLALEAELLASLLVVYGHEVSGDAGRARLYALWAGAGLADAAKNAGLGLGAQTLAAVLAGSLPGQLLRRLQPWLVKAILKRLGLGWVPRILKLWPVVGAPVGYVLDRAAVAALGRVAIEALETQAQA